MCTCRPAVCMATQRAFMVSVSPPVLQVIILVSTSCVVSIMSVQEDIYADDIISCSRIVQEGAEETDYS